MSSTTEWTSQLLFGTAKRLVFTHLIFRALKPIFDVFQQSLWWSVWILLEAFVDIAGIFQGRVGRVDDNKLQSVSLSRTNRSITRQLTSSCFFPEAILPAFFFSQG